MIEAHAEIPKKIIVPEADVVEWYRAGWSYVERDARDGTMCIIRWDHASDPVQPFKGRAEG